MFVASGSFSLSAFRVLAIALIGWCLATVDGSAGTLDDYVSSMDAAEILPGADRVSDEPSENHIVAVYGGGNQLGYIFLNTDWANSVGYSGKPIDILIGISMQGVITGGKLVAHKEPIVLVGIPERKITDYIAGYTGFNIAEYAQSDELDALPDDIVSGATVTIMVIDDSIRRSAIKVARTLGLGGLEGTGAVDNKFAVDMSQDASKSWDELLGDGSVRRLLLSKTEVAEAFAEIGGGKKGKGPQAGADDTPFIDLYTAIVSIPTIGHSLLGDAEYGNLQKVLKPGQQALLVAANGEYSFKGSGYVRGGVFDRIQVIQGDNSVRFRDKHHKRLGDIAAEGAPKFKEVALFVIPEGLPFDPAASWHLQLLVQRQMGALEREFTTFGIDYTPPATYLRKIAISTTDGGAGNVSAERNQVSTQKSGADTQNRDELWKRIWKSRTVDIAVLSCAILLLTGLFFFQDWFVRRRKLTERIRTGFLIFTVVWIGYYANAQLSVVNVLTVANSFGSGFDWSYFLMDPLIFMLWFAVAASLIFWGRGAYCGWLCPFGALQELLNKLAKKLRVPQIAVPFGLHQRLWPIKYIVFLVLFGVSFHAFDQAEHLAEIEPFKTAIILSFMRDWPFVLFAVLLLVAGLFVERFYCRYLCPLGAALAIPSRIRVNDWLKRYRECGSPCHRCAKECMVQAIHPDGHIDPNECLYCLHCQELYYDDQNCPVVIQKLARFERRMALQSGTPKPQTQSKTKPSSASCGPDGCSANCSQPKSSDGNPSASN